MTATTAPDHGSRVRRRSRLTTALATAGTAVTLLASEVLDPVGDGTAENFVAAATGHRAAMITSAWLLLVSAVLLLPAVVGVVRLVPGRGAGLAHAGAVLLTLGAFGHAMAGTFYLVAAELPSPLGVQRAEVAIDHLNGSAALAPSFVFIMAFALGLLLAFIGLHRGGVVPGWVLGAVAGAFAIEVVAPGDVPAVAVVKQALALVAFVYLAVVLWRGSEVARAA